MTKRVRIVVLMRQAWVWAVGTPRRLHAFILAGQLGPSYQSHCC